MRTRDLWELRETARSHSLAPPRLRRCGRVAYKKEIELHHCAGVSWWDGVVRCRSRACPVCWVTRRVRAALEITWVAEQWTGSSYLTTFTVRHSKADKAVLARQVRECWRTLLQRRAWKRMFAGMGAQWVIAEEVTLGDNGWHPHLHMLLLTERPIADYVQTAGDFYEQWFAMVSQRLGAEHAPDPHHGLDLRPCDSATYLSKLGIELADPTAIKGRSPLQLLREGKLDNYMQLQESRKRARDITYSRGLRELRDAMPVQEIDATVIARLSGLQWSFLSSRKHGLGPLQVLESGANPEAAKAELRHILGPLAGETIT